jgi:hypothetical protein
MLNKMTELFSVTSLLTLKTLWIQFGGKCIPITGDLATEGLYKLMQSVYVEQMPELHFSLQIYEVRLLYGVNSMETAAQAHEIWPQKAYKKSYKQLMLNKTQELEFLCGIY